MILETWVMSIFLLCVGGGEGGLLSNVEMLRMFRLLRLSKMARIVRLLHVVPELVVIVKGMMAAMRSVFFTFCLLAGVIYVFSIAFVQLMKGTESGGNYFATVPMAMNSLFLNVVLPDESAIIEAVGDDGWVFKVLILLYTLLSALTIMNLLIGVLCEVVSVVAIVEKEAMTINYVKDTLLSICYTTGLDSDGDNMISQVEFEALLQYPGAANALIEIGVDPVGLLDFSDFLFKNGALTFGDFMDLVLHLRGCNYCTVKDVIDLRKYVKDELNALQIAQNDSMAQALKPIIAK